MEDIQHRYDEAPDFQEYLEGVEAHRELWRSLYERALVPQELVDASLALGCCYKLLALSEDWCGDAVNILPVVARWVDELPNAELKVLDRDDNLDLMDAHLTGGRSRSIPVIIVYDEDFNEMGWWGPRPGPLQEWVLGEGQALSKEDRYREVRRWYARDRGRTTLLGILEKMRPASVGEVPDTP